MSATLPDDCALLGVDGGASGVRVHRVLPVAGGFALGEERAERGGPQVEGAAAGIVEVARAAGAARVFFGMGMPGVKTPDGRGIASSRHGPEDVDFLDRVEALVRAAGVALLQPCERLDSDGYLCGVGEDLGEDGSFGDVRDAYYVGGGTGVAECMKLDGRVAALDELGIPRAWELGFEERISVAGLNLRFGGHPEEAGDAGLPELEETARAFAELVHLRNDALPHLERVVLGQRLALLFAPPVLRDLLRRAFADEGLDPELLMLSRLRAAPALGAGAAAFARAFGEPA